MDNKESKEEFINEFDETQELVDLLDDNDLIDIESFLDEPRDQDKGPYMDIPLQLELPDKIAGQSGVKLFIEQVSGLPRLNFQGQRDAKERFEKGDRQALQELVITGLPWISKIAEKYGERCPDEFLDYLHEGIFGLVEAICRWDPKKGALAQYASFWIHQKITRYIMEAGSSLRHPVHVHEKRRKVIEKIRRTGKMPPNVNSADLATWLPPASLNSNLSWVLRTSVKEQALRRNENPLPFSQYFFEDLPGPSDLEDDLVHRVYLEEVRQWFSGLELKKRERFVLSYRYGFSSNGEKKTLEEVGDLLGVTRERVRQIEAKAIRRLRHPSRLNIIKVLDKSVRPLRKAFFRGRYQPKIKQSTHDNGILRNLSQSEMQILIQDTFHNLFDRDVTSEVDLEAALHEVEAPKIKRCWETLFDVASVQQALTTKQKTTIAAVIDGELHVTQRELGLMKRGLIRLYRKVLA